jgi:hypothetical protein
MAHPSTGTLARYAGKTARIARMVGLLILSRFGRRPVASAAADGPVVSMATYGRRSMTAHLAIEAIARGSVRPSRLVVTVDGGSLDAIPAGLRRAARRGLEVRVAAGYGPHTKYYPYVSGADPLDRPLVTADDDVFYPRHWLRTLVAAHRADPSDVVCWRARQFTVVAGRAAPYSTWPEQDGAGRGYHLVPIGVAGVLYPPGLQSELRSRGEAFLDLVPRADDLWLHWVALQAGYPARRVDEADDDFPLIPFSQAGALHVENVEQRRNDQYVAALYAPADIERITAARSG